MLLLIVAFTNFLWLFLVQKVSYTFHYNNVFQKRHVFLEPTIVYIFLHTRNVVDKIQISDDELHWHFDFRPSPCSCKLPVPAVKN